MELKSLVCPHCGANTTNAQNCEYCGSLLVRFVDKGIDISNTSYASGENVFPGLLKELRNNLKLQKENPGVGVTTDMQWMSGEISMSVSILRSGHCIWLDGSCIDMSSGADSGLVIVLGYDLNTDTDLAFFSKYNKKVDEQLAKFRQLKSFELFTAHTGPYTDVRGHSTYCRDYAIDFGSDAEGAAALISEILTAVYGLSSTDNYDIYTEVGVDNITNARNAWNAAHGFGEYADEDNSSYDFLNNPIVQIIVGCAVAALLAFL